MRELVRPVKFAHTCAEIASAQPVGRGQQRLQRAHHEPVAHHPHRPRPDQRGDAQRQQVSKQQLIGGRNDTILPKTDEQIRVARVVGAGELRVRIEPLDSIQARGIQRACFRRLSNERLHNRRFRLIFPCVRLCHVGIARQNGAIVLHHQQHGILRQLGAACDVTQPRHTQADRDDTRDLAVRVQHGQRQDHNRPTGHTALHIFTDREFTTCHDVLEIFPIRDVHRCTGCGHRAGNVAVGSDH